MLSQVAQDPESGGQGAVAELGSAGAPVAVLLLDLGQVEQDNCCLQRVRDGLEVSLPAGRRPPLFGVVGEGEALAGEERG